jgi:hypothetical protein
MPWYPRILAAINSALPTLATTQATNLALLVSAILARRTCCLSALARAYPTPAQRRVAAPKHDLLHRLKRLWRFLDNDRIDPLAVQTALIPHTLASLGRVRWLGLAIDWTMWDVTLPTGQRMRYQVLRIAVPLHGRSLPLLQLAYDRDHLPADASQNQLEERALAAVLAALPPGVRPVILADRGFARASLFQWLQERRADYVIRVNKGTCLTDARDVRMKLGDAGMRPGQVRWLPRVRYGLSHGRPRDLWLNVACCWRVARRHADRRRKAPKEPCGCPLGSMATSLADAGRTVAWYWRRGWIEQSFKDSKSGFGMDAAQIRCPLRLTRLLAALTIALSWLTLLGLPRLGLLPDGWHAHVSQRGHASILSQALAFLDEFHTLPAACLPSPL